MRVKILFQFGFRAETGLKPMVFMKNKRSDEFAGYDLSDLSAKAERTSFTLTKCQCSGWFKVCRVPPPPSQLLVNFFFSHGCRLFQPAKNEEVLLTERNQISTIAASDGRLVPLMWRLRQFREESPPPRPLCCSHHHHHQLPIPTPSLPFR